jgi:radical SAM superfamily enzyme YgiQ (UPF0313 family)
MKIAFILPSIGKKKGKKCLKSWKMEPITIAVLNKLTPGHFEREFYDDRIELIDFDTDADVIAITCETYTAKRAYEIARRFKEKGKLIVMGGYHATTCTDEVEKHADITVVGNAEGVWETVLHDIEQKQYQAVYQGGINLDYGIPDRSIYQAKMKQYLSVGLVEIGRGCRHQCEFCSIHSYYKKQYHHRKIEDIIAEIKSLKNKVYFLVDDSIFSDRQFAKQLFTELIKLKIIWTTQVTLDIAKDEELLKLMYKSGCRMVLIGFESLNTDNLKQMDKTWNEKIGLRDELIERIHRTGISIYASFVFGFDQDTKESVQETLDFCKKHGFFTAAFNHLLLLPGTKTYDTFKENGLLLSENWWLDEGYTFGTLSFDPKNISKEELKESCNQAKIEFFSFRSIIKRSFQMFKRNQSPLMNFVFWMQNIVLHFDVGNRFNIPVGENLDELPK